MDPEKHRLISSKAGTSSQASGKGHRFKKGREASAAGRRGGISSGKVRGARKRAAPPAMPTGDAASPTGEGQAKVNLA